MKLLAIPFLAILGAQAPAQESEFRPLFNGQNLDGWLPINCHEGTWTAKDGMIVCSGQPTGLLRTDRMYENFILEMDWRHMQAGGNAGLFVWSDPVPHLGVAFARAVEVQVMDGPNGSWYTTHGDIFPIWGATMTPIFPNPHGGSRCLPSEERSNPSPEWNHYRVTCLAGSIRLEVNGKEVSGGDNIAPRKGYLVLESEGSEAHFRNLRIQELPPSSSLPTRQEIALEATGMEPLFGGTHLNAWQEKGDKPKSWTTRDWQLRTDGRGSPLWTRASFGDLEVSFHARWSKTSSGVGAWVGKKGQPNSRVILNSGAPGKWKAFHVRLNGQGAVGFSQTGAAMTFANILARPVPTHEAVQPAERDAEWWQARHAAMNARATQGNARVVFVGDSITQAWEVAGAQVWQEFFAPLQAVNLGIGGDRTQHVIWRLQNGNLKGIQPEVAVIMIGTNNSGSNTSVEIADGIREVVRELQARVAKIEILLLAIFPRGAGPADALRRVTEGANNLTEAWAGTQDRVHFLDIGAHFLDEQRLLSKTVMPDLLHLNPASYQTWAEAIAPSVDALLAN